MTQRPKILCTSTKVGDEVQDILDPVADVDYRPGDRQLLLATIHQYDAWWLHYHHICDREILARGTRLKAINTATTGTDHIDKDEAARRGVRVLCTAKDIGMLEQFTATAEIGWMMLLGCMRHARRAYGMAVAGEWIDASVALEGRQLYKRTLGILGMGRLGRMTAGFGQGFRMRVLGCDHLPFEAPGVQQVDFDTLLAESDVICLHIHMTPENRHIINAQTFAKMKRGAVLINTSRGDLIDEAALIAALESGQLSAFGADVLHGEGREPMAGNPVVRYAQTHQNVLLTPHIGGSTRDSVHVSRRFSARKLIHFLQTGEELAWPAGAPEPIARAFQTA